MKNPLNIYPYHKDDLIKTSLNCIVGRIIHDDFIMQTNWFQLLDSGADASLHD